MLPILVISFLGAIVIFILGLKSARIAEAEYKARKKFVEFDNTIANVNTIAEERDRNKLSSAGMGMSASGYKH